MNKQLGWWANLKKSATEEMQEIADTLPRVEKFGETLTPNLRALRLTMTISDMLLSLGMSSSSVVSKALDITETYCARPVHIDISSSVLMLSQLRGIEKEPLTLIRPVAMRDTNYMSMHEVQKLVYEIHEGHLSLDQAEQRLDDILKKPKKYPWWLIMLGDGGIAGGVSLMFSTNWRIILVTFIMGMLVDRIIAYFVKKNIPAFFRQAGAAACITLMAALINLAADSGIDFFKGMNPTLMVVGGIVMLVAGLVIVGAIQDAIEEYYVTATARMLKVGMLTIGIIIGILIGLYTVRKLGFGIAVSANPLHLTAIHFQIAGGAIAAAAYAIATQTRARAVIWAGIVGGGALAVMYTAKHLGISVIPASGLAALFVGLIASPFSRRWKTPSLGIISAGIVPLVPGLSLYTALMQLVSYPTGDYRGLATLFAALATALSIAAGASFGAMLARPLHRDITHYRNLQPFVGFMRRQIRADHRKHRKRLAGFVLRQPDDDNSGIL